MIPARIADDADRAIALSAVLAMHADCRCSRVAVAKNASGALSFGVAGLQSARALGEIACAGAPEVAADVQIACAVVPKDIECGEIACACLSNAAAWVKTACAIPQIAYSASKNAMDGL